MITVRFSPLLFAVVLLGCVDRSATAPGFLADRRGQDRAAITVMTQNLYVGADVDLVIQALGTPDQGDDFPALQFAIETLGKTAFPARAEAIADKIARTRPHAVGLQEVSEIDIDLRPLGVPVVVNQSFLAILQDALVRRGLHYQVVATVTNINVSLVSGLVRLVDHDALLVDADRVSANAAGGRNFAVNLGEVAPGVVLVRGWVWARTTIGGRSYTFASAHTEANLAGAPQGFVAQIRAAQVGEIVASVGSDERVVLMGDLNDTPGSPMYDVLASAGFIDAWAALRQSETGNTCCHLADLSDPVTNFSQRIDYVLARGLQRRAGELSGEIQRFGVAPTDRLAGPAYLIWPSDHAGLVATLQR
jgi:hypothetical protein